MSLKNNIFFRVGVAPITEPRSVEVNGETYTVGEGLMFTLKLYEDGKFRIKTSWHVSKEDSQQPDFKKETQLLIQDRKKFLIDYWNNKGRKRIIHLN